MLISCLILTGAAALFSINVAKMVDEVGESNETIVYIKEGYSQLEAVYVGKEIEKVPNVASARFYSKEEAFEQYRSTLGDSLFSRIEDRNPLPDSFIVVMHDLSQYDDTVAQIQKIEGVDPDTILNRKDFADKLTRISKQPRNHLLDRGCFRAAGNFAVHHREHHPRHNVFATL